VAVNGDGATWIKSRLDGEGEHFQLDRFHISKAVIRQVYDRKEAKKILKLLKEQEVEQALERIDQLKYESGGEAAKVKKLIKLETYLTANKDGLISYKDREGIQLPEPPEGLYYRNLGTMEHNIFDVLGHRMKGRKMSWSIPGANHLSKILSVKASGKLYDTISAMLSSVVPAKSLKRFEEAVQAVADKIECVRKQPKLYPIHRASMPFTGYVTSIRTSLILSAPMGA
jgi:hypothetical protein